MTVAHQNYKATTVAATWPPHELAASHREDLLAMLEPDPLLLLGGDEVTISLPHAFEQLGLVHVAVERLQSLANARIAVTRTGKGEGAAGHDRAMKASESAHDLLKTYEQLARDLRGAAHRVQTAKHDALWSLVAQFERLFTVSGRDDTPVLHGRDGGKVEHVEQMARSARALLNEAGIHDKR